MLSTEDLERLITMKRCEIELEKTVLGLSPANNNAEDKGNVVQTEKKARASRPRALSESSALTQDAVSCDQEQIQEEEISPDLERYIRRYVGLPAMLKAGEYSPNNPLIRGERNTGDVLLGLGEYERRRNTLRKIRQRQYKEYLDQQAKKKQEAKEQAERERKEREEKDRLREERERLELERVNSPERRRASVSHTYVAGANNTYITKVDTGVQVDRRSTPLSVAVQTDDDTLLRLAPSTPVHNLLTQAERELSPHTVGDGRELQCASHQWDWKTLDKNHNYERRRSHGDCDERTTMLKKPRDRLSSELRHTYMPSIFDAEAIRLRNEQAEKEAAERRQFYQQELKNQIMEQQRIKEERKNREKMLEQAEMRRLEEQLRSLKMAQEREVDRQHDIKSAMKDNAADYERKRMTLQKEIDLEHQALLKAAIHPKRNTNTSKSESPKHTKLPVYYKYDDKYTSERENPIYSQNYDVDSYLRRNLNPAKETLRSNKLENNNNNLKITSVHEIPKELRYLSGTIGRTKERDTRIFTEDTQKRQVEEIKLPEHKKTYGFPKGLEKLTENLSVIDYKVTSKVPENIQRLHDKVKDIRQSDNKEKIYGYPKEIGKLNEHLSVHDNKVPENIERLHDKGKDIRKLPENKVRYEYTNDERLQEGVERNNIYVCEDKDETLLIPVLRHSSRPRISFEEETSELSEKMQIVDDKWKVPAVQKNILKSLPNEKGKNVSILTQLGSIRRQLQLEQLKLDKMLSKNHN